MSAVALAHNRDRLARIRAGLPMRTDVSATPDPKPTPAPRARLERVETTAVRCVYCGAPTRDRGVPTVCHAHDDLPGLEHA